MTWIDWLVHLIVNSALASHNRGKTMQMNEARLASAGSATAMPSSPIDNELVRIDNSLNALDTELGNLCSRLGTVLEPEQQEKQSSDPSVGTVRSIERSWLHGNLREKADKIDRLTTAVNALRNRVTL